MTTKLDGEDRVNAFSKLETVFGDTILTIHGSYHLEMNLSTVDLEDGTTGWQVWPTNPDNFSVCI